MHKVTFFFLFIHLHGARPNHHIHDSKEQNTNAPHSHSHSLLILPHWTVELDGGFSAAEIHIHSKWWHFTKQWNMLAAFTLQKSKFMEILNCSVSIFTYTEAPVFLLRPPERKSLPHFVWKHCLSANDLLWVERRSRLAIQCFFCVDRGDMMIAQPLPALENPLLLMVPPVFVAQVRQHSGFQC